MSTKTTFKRIALVAVAALGFGLLSVAPSSAAVSAIQADALTLASAATTATNGGTAVAVINQSFISGALTDSMTVTASLVSAPVGSVFPLVLTSAGGTNVNTAGTTISGFQSSTVALATSTYTTGFTTATFSPVVAGTYVVKFTPGFATSAGNTYTLNSAAVTWTFTVAAVAIADAASTLSYKAAGGATLPTAVTDALAIATAGAGAQTQAAAILVTPMAGTTNVASTTKLTATISGPGTLGVGNSQTQASSGRAITAGSFANTDFYVTVWSDGTTGVATITISAGTVVLATEKVTFYGAVATVATTVVNSVIAVGSTNAANIGAITAIAKDALGNPVANATLYATSGTVATISDSYTASTAVTDSTGKASFTLTGVVAGSANVVVGNGSTAALTTVSAAAVSIRVGSTTASAVKLSFDKATYTPGELATITVLVTDSTGLAVVNGAYPVFTAPVTSSIALTGTANLPTASVTVGTSTGTKTYAVNMPVTTGDVTISALGDTGLAAAQAGLKVSATVTVTPSAAQIEAADAIAAAADAAAEATDAANAATDAANAAAEAADAATAAAQDAADAVAALSVQVSELIAGLKAQISSQRAAIRALTNLIIKIQKKLRA